MIESMEITKETKTLTIPPQELVCDFMDHQHFGCLDRVVVMNGTFTGMTGTVVGVHGDLLDIVMDEKNPQFNNLSKLCSDKRGLSIHKNGCLNTSQPQPFIDAKWGRVEDHVKNYKQENIRGRSNNRGRGRGGAKSTKYRSDQSFSSIVNSEKALKSKQDDLKAILGIK